MKYNIGLSNVDLGLSESVKVVVDTPEYLVVQVDDSEWALYPADFDSEFDNPVTIKSAKIYNPSRADIATGVLRYSGTAPAISAIESLIEDGLLSETIRTYNSDGKTSYRLTGDDVIVVLQHKNAGKGRSANPDQPIWQVLKLASKHVPDVVEYVKQRFGYDPSPVKLSEFSKRKDKQAENQ